MITNKSECYLVLLSIFLGVGIVSYIVGLVFATHEIVYNTVLTDLGSINVTKSIEKYPMIPRTLQALDTASVAVHSTEGSTEVWGTEKPQHLKGDAA